MQHNINSCGVKLLTLHYEDQFANQICKYFMNHLNITFHLDWESRATRGVLCVSWAESLSQEIFNTVHILVGESSSCLVNKLEK